MQLGKTDGEHVAFGLTWSGFSIFVPRTRWTYAAWFGFSLCITSRPGEFVPIVVYGRAGDATDRVGKIYSVLRHLRAPYNVIRVGALRA